MPALCTHPDNDQLTITRSGHMKILSQVKNSVRGILLRHGPGAVKKRMWNQEYTSGKWDGLDSMPDDCVIPFLNKHARGGSILDVGCGPGAIGDAIAPEGYSSYVGVDIADVAIEKAKGKNTRPRNVYLQGDMQSYEPSGLHEVIHFGDSLYYFSVSAAGEILARYSSFLSETGVFVMRCWVARERPKAIVALVEAEYEVIEKEAYVYNGDPMVVIVFRPKLRRERRG